MSAFFSIFPIIFFIMFFLVFGIIIFTIFRNISQWNKNNNSPRISCDVKVVAKRTQTHYRNNDCVHSYSDYYATFQFESGDRLELSMSGNEFGLLAEGDTGKLTFQGTRFLSFERYSNYM